MHNNMAPTTTVNLGGAHSGYEEPQDVRPMVEDLALTKVPVARGPSGVKISAYKSGGAVIAYADCANPTMLDSPTTKVAVFEYRLSIGMSGAGMEALGGLWPLRDSENPPCLLDADDYTIAKQQLNTQSVRAYRREFQLTPGI